MNLCIDPELESVIPPLSDEEFCTLRANILKIGRILDPIKVWRDPETGIVYIGDGHNRWRIYQDNPHLPPPALEYLAFDTKEELLDWMRTNQRGRRNLSKDQRLIMDIMSGAPVDASLYTPSMIANARTIVANDTKKAEQVRAGAYGILTAFNTWKAEQSRLNPTSATTPTAPRLSPKLKGRIHVVIGDTQVKEGVPTKHLEWIGRYIVEQFQGQDISVIHLGDHWDMPSLSSYDEGKRCMVGRSYDVDVDAGNKAFALLTSALDKYNEGRKRPWKPQLHFLMGNHEDRITRAAELVSNQFNPKLSDLLTPGWNRHPFLEVLKLDGVSYSHYFYNPNTGRPLGGENLHTRLKTVGRSFTMGHQQGLNYAVRCVGDDRHHGLVVGSTYLHQEKYLGPQVESYWRGIVVCHQVENGAYDPMFVSLDYLCRRYEGKPSREWLEEYEAAEKEKVA